MDCFSDAIEYTYDECIKKLLKSFSRGKFIKGFSYTSGYLQHRENKVKVEKDPKQFVAIINFIETCVKKKDTRVNKPWKNLRKIRNDIVIDFINKCKQVYNLNNSEKMQLFSLIELGIFCKLINEDNIVFTHNRIDKMSSLMFNEHSRTFSFMLNN
jgi:ribosomal protein S8